MFSGVKKQDHEFSPGNVITFDTAVINTAGALNLNSGVFQVPRGAGGIFAFSFSSFTGKKTQCLWIDVEKNGSVLFRILDCNDRPNVEGDNVSFNFIEELQDGDTIRLKLRSGGYNSLHSSPTNNVIFSGIRL